MFLLPPLEQSNTPTPNRPPKIYTVIDYSNFKKAPNSVFRIRPLILFPPNFIVKRDTKCAVTST